MMLCKLSLANIRKSIKDYAIYFFTLILGVCIFYIFNCLDSQTAMMNVSDNTYEIIKLLVTIINFLSVFVAFILGFLIIYASRFLIKKRNKEFAIYLTLGMSKRKVSIILLIETFLIGLISLVVGLVMGVLVSQITSIFVANLFEANLTSFTFVFSKSALIKTIIYFGLIYFIVMIFNVIMLNKYKLIDLFNKSKKAEEIKLKNPVICLILFIISILFLAIAYYLVNDGFYNILEKYGESIYLLPIILGVIGTILFFYSLASMFLRILTKFKNIYYKGLNSFIYKNISSKINTMVISISIICVMLFFTICLLSSALSIKNYFNNSIVKYAPVDFNIVNYVYQENEYLSKERVLNLIYNDNLIKNNVKDINLISLYHDPNFNYGTSLGSSFNSVSEQYPFLDFTSIVDIVTESDYNKIANLYHLKNLNLNSDEYQIVANYNTHLYNDVIKNEEEFIIFGNTLKPHYHKVLDGFLAIGGNPTNIGFIVVDDSIITNLDNSTIDHLVVGNYKTSDKHIIKQLELKFDQYEKDTPILIETINDIKDNSVGLAAVVTFIGLYLGIIFLISSSAILALKELSDSLDDKEKYQMLRNIGTDEKLINKTIFKTTLIFFLLPLLLALVHTIFGLKFCLIVLESLGVESLTKGMVITSLLIIFVYGGYFLITYLCNKNIIKGKI